MARLTFHRPAAAANASSAVAPELGSGGRCCAGPALDGCEVAVGPGWFESTFDLWQGLEVREEQPGVAAWADLDLWHLRVCAAAEVRYAA